MTDRDELGNEYYELIGPDTLSTTATIEATNGHREAAVTGMQTEAPKEEVKAARTAERTSTLPDWADADDNTPVQASRHAEIFFDRGNVLGVDLANAVLERVPLATDPGGRLYSYSRGVWRLDGERTIRAHVIDLLGNAYRPSHSTLVESIITARKPRISEEMITTRYINVANGLLDWRTGELHPHTPDVISVNQIPVEWDPDADCPHIRSWLKTIMKEDCLELIEEILGAAIYPDLPWQTAVMLYGSGGNGKGTFLRLVQALVGKENTASLSPQSLDQHRFAAAELYGKLANIAGDVDPKTFRETEMFKRATGGDMLPAEQKYGQPFEFRNRALMLCSFNAFPRTADTSEGFFRRWVVLPFLYKITSEDPDVEGRMHTEDELRGLLVMAVQGLRRLMKRGAFEEPASVRRITNEFKRKADPVRSWLHDNTIGEEGHWISRTLLYEDYKSWCSENGMNFPLTAAEFYARLEASGAEQLGTNVRKAKRGGERGFAGLRFRRPNEQRCGDDDDIEEIIE